MLGSTYGITFSGTLLTGMFYWDQSTSLFHYNYQIFLEYYVILFYFLYFAFFCISAKAIHSFCGHAYHSKE